MRYISVWNKICPNKYYDDLKRIHRHSNYGKEHGCIAFCKDDSVYADVQKYPIINIFPTREGVTLMPTDGLNFNRAYNKAIAFSKRKSMRNSIGLAFGDVHIKNGIITPPEDGTIKANSAQVYIDLLAQRLNDNIVEQTRDLDEFNYFR